ncbi:rhomboid family protein [Alkalicoccobacillus murimartini]|uniref:Rhomboid protease GluP n=1 Tax=Alkalicoccobacillus murimartini TaxID=171685 RepID=A0ABT9YCL4_9BACI|nr:rhomboid family intramembrane serine protease [Alkalicoccobacillus murimartini]MDQ0205596.1 rhomboid protease GluP [Alkalicoccobacillus murimartini]
MNVKKYDAYYWKLVYTLVVKQQYRIVSLQNHEVWLINEKSKSKKMIRLVRTDLDWANRLKQEMDLTFRKLDPLRRQLKRQNLHVDNIYVAVLPPVDDWEYIINERMKHPNGKTSMHTFLLDSDYQRQLNLLQGELAEYKLPEIQNDGSEDAYEQEVAAYQHAVKQFVKAKHDEEQKTFSRGKPVVTFTMLTAIFLMFIWLEYVGGSTSTLTLIDWGAKYNPAIVDGEWWRLISSMFLHIGFLHLFMNSLALYFLGTLVERIYGSIRFFVVYMIAGLTGSLASFAYMDAVSAGASGAIFGCFGALLYFGIIHRELFFRTMGTNVMVILAINLALGFMVQGIDMGAHLGGLAGGFLAAAVVQLPKQKSHWLRYIAMLAILAGSIFLWSTGERNLAYQPETDLQIAAERIENDQLQEAIPYLERALDNEITQPEAHFYLAYIYLNEDRAEEAIPLLEEAIDIRPDFHEAIYNLALAYAIEGEDEKARSLLEDALELQPEEQLYLDLQEELEG